MKSSQRVLPLSFSKAIWGAILLLFGSFIAVADDTLLPDAEEPAWHDLEVLEAEASSEETSEAEATSSESESLDSENITVASPPPPPSNFQATINGQNANGLTVNTTTPTIHFSWSAGMGISQYHIVLHDPQGVWPDGWLTNGSTSTLNVVPQGLQSGVEYGYSIRAKDTAGVWSNFVMGGEFAVNVSGGDTTPPSQPGNFIAMINGQNAHGQNITDTTPNIQFSWNAASDPESGIKKYHIVLIDDDQGVWVEGSRWFIQAPATIASLTPEIPLTTGVYRYAIRAANNATPEMWGSWQEGGSFTVNPNQTCVPNPDDDLVLEFFFVNPSTDTAQARFRNNSSFCSYNLGLSAYEVTVAWEGDNASEFLAGQRHFSNGGLDTDVIAPGAVTTLNIAIPPNCQYQVDVFEYHKKPGDAQLPNPILMPPDFGANQDRFTLFDFNQFLSGPLCGGTVPPQLNCVISANPTSVAPGGASTLTWTTTSAVSASIDQGIGSVQTGTDKQRVVNPMTTTKYTMTVTGSAGNQFHCDAEVTVTQTPPNCVRNPRQDLVAGQLPPINIITVSGTKARVPTGTILRNRSQNCPYDVALASYGITVPLSAGRPAFLNGQRLFDFDTVHLEPGAELIIPLEVDLPACQYQVDLFEYNVAAGGRPDAPAAEIDANQGSKYTTLDWKFSPDVVTDDPSVIVPLCGPPVCVLTNDGPVQVGQAGFLRWDVSGNPTSGSMTPAIPGPNNFTIDSQGATNPLFVTTEFTLVVSNIFGSNECKTIIPVLPGPGEPVLSKSVRNDTTGQSSNSSVNASQNDVLTYTLNAQNTGNVAINHVFTDDVSDIAQYAVISNISDGGTLASGVITWPALSINAGQTRSVTFRATVNPAAQWPAGGDLRMTNVYGNIITVFLPPNCTLVANPTSISSGGSSTLTWTTQGATSGSFNPNIGPVVPLAGGSIVVNPTQTTDYVLTVLNARGQQAVCPARVTVSTGPNNPTCTLVANPTSIPAGGSSTLTWTTTNATSASINQGIGNVTPVAGGSVSVSPTQTTTYTLTAVGPGGTVECPAQVTVTSVPNLVLSKSVRNDTTGQSSNSSVNASQNDVLTYTLNAQNTGNVAINHVFTDDVSDIAQYAVISNISDGGTLASGVITWPALSINAGQTRSVTFRATVNPAAQWPAGGDLRMTNVYGNTITIVLPPKVAITKDVTPSSVVTGQQATYTIVVTNTSSTARNLTVMDTLIPFVGGDCINNPVTGSNGGTLTFNSASAVFSAGSGPMTGPAPVANTTFCGFILNNMQPNATATITYTAQAIDSGIPFNQSSLVRNTATIVETGDNDTADVFIVGPTSGCVRNCGGGGGGGGGRRIVRGDINVFVQKEVFDPRSEEWKDADTFDLAAKLNSNELRSVRYRINIKNEGSIRSEITVEDKFASASLKRDEVRSVEGATWDEGDQEFTIASVGAGNTVTISYTAAFSRIAGSSGENVSGVNTATVVGAEVAGRLPFNVRLSQTQGVGRNDPAYVRVSGDVVLLKRVDKLIAKPGEELNYILSLRNMGDNTYTNVVLRDTFPFEFLDILSSDTEYDRSGDVLEFRRSSFGAQSLWVVRIKARIKDGVSAGTIIPNVVRVDAENEDFSDKEARVETRVDFTKPPRNVPTGPQHVALVTFLFFGSLLAYRLRKRGLVR